MATTVQSRFDTRAQEALNRLIRTHGWTTSQALRESVLRLAEQTTAKPIPRLIGVGCVDSGVPDLATNKAYMKDFGVKSMGKGWKRPKSRRPGKKVMAK
jgi:hypothetical protein